MDLLQGEGRIGEGPHIQEKQHAMGQVRITDKRDEYRKSSGQWFYMQQKGDDRKQQQYDPDGKNPFRQWLVPFSKQWEGKERKQPYACDIQIFHQPANVVMNFFSDNMRLGWPFFSPEALAVFLKLMGWSAPISNHSELSVRAPDALANNYLYSARITCPGRLIRREQC